MANYGDKLTPMQSAALGSPSVEKRARFVADDAIRRCGWAIHSRPRVGPVLWAQSLPGGGELVMTQEKVIEIERLDADWLDQITNDAAAQVSAE